MRPRNFVIFVIGVSTTTVSNSANITATSLLNATDNAGKVVMTVGVAAGSTDYVQVNFNKLFSTAPIVVISAADGVTAPNSTKFYATSTTTNFRIYLATSITGSFTFSYMVMETQ
jgi:hypothetical protein